MEESKTTELDKAQAFVKENPDEIHVFYNTLLSSILYLPTHNTPEAEAIGGEKKLKPIFAQSGDTLFLLIFDSLERLSAWAKKDIGYVGLEGYAILDMMDPKFHWFLNYGSKNGREFGTDEITWLKSAVQKVTNSNRTIEKDVAASLGALKHAPEGMIEALEFIARKCSEVQEACLGQFALDGNMEQADLALAIRVDPVTEKQQEYILNEFTRAARQIIDDSKEFWIFVAGETDLAERLFSTVKPFFSR